MTKSLGNIKSGSVDIEENISNLRKFLAKKVRGQPKAIDTVCDLIEDVRTLSTLEERRGPIGNLMFLGPSGVGKTEIVRALSQYFFGSEYGMTRIECGALSQSHTIQVLTGAPPSYVGYDKIPILASQKVFQHKTRPEIKDIKFEQLNKLLKRAHRLQEEIDKIQKKWADLMNGLAFMKGSLDNFRTLSLLLERQGIETEDSRDPLDGFEEIRKSHKTARTEINLFSRLYTEKRIELGLLYDQLDQLREKGLDMDDSDSKIDNNDPDQMAIILFDEVEKAHTDIHNLLLHIMEEGEITLANGEKSNLRNAIIIMTSNVGATAISNLQKDKSIGFSGPRQKSSTIVNDFSEKYLEDLDKKILAVSKGELKKKFSSTFIGRLDAVVVFRPLSNATFLQILNDRIETFQESLQKNKGIVFSVDEEVKQKVLQASLHQPEVGARLLNHKFTSMIKRPLGRRLSKKIDFSGNIRTYLNNDLIDFEFITKAR